MNRLHRPEPPDIHATPHYDPDARVLRYEYNGRPLITIHAPDAEDGQYRVASDGLLQSSPTYQQIYVVVFSEPVQATVTLNMSEDAVTMRPRRAGAEQAVLGQVGRPAIAGVNGVYDILDDLLVSWHGQPWRWLEDRFRINEAGGLSISFQVELSRKPWVINVKPHYYRRHLGYSYHEPWARRPDTKPVAGWCSWEAYRREVTEENILAAADFLSRHFGAYGLEYVQIDDGYQRQPVTISAERTLADAWMEPNDDFPAGFESLCRRVGERGLSPGIWISASFDGNETGEEDYILRDGHGEPLHPFFMNVAIDCKPEHLEKHILPLYQEARNRGFRYIKVDQIRHLLYDALYEMVRLGLLSNREAEERFRNYMRTIRQGLGDDIYLLASWGVLSEAVGVVDACRIACDASPKWQQVRMQFAESARWYHTQRILFLNDPDHICARTKPSWAKSLLSLVSLSGGLFMLSDAIDAYDAERIRMIQRTLPPLATIAGETGPLDADYPAFAWTKQHGAAFKGESERSWDQVSDEDAYLLAGDHETMHNDHPLASLWAFHIDRSEGDGGGSGDGVGRWCVALRVATLPLAASTLSLANLGLDPDQAYLAFDFWAEEFLGVVRGAMDVPALDLGDCQVIAFREPLSHPHFLATTRHVSMGAVSVEAQTWDGQTLTLTLSLAGVPNSRETYWLHVPDGWRLASAEGEGADVRVDAAAGEIVALSVGFQQTQIIVRTYWRTQIDRGLGRLG